ncbi:MAG TPA: mechanosensitive ion channel domain-containing protein [Thermoleophilaceae bacterium]|nr:mechanosensitive ion channel domain-containing protein [Thermoleophilaceae bacterium]
MPIAAWEDYRNEVTAVATLIAAFVLAQFIDRALIRRGRALGATVTGRALSPEADTRLRLVRRLVFAAIVVIGIALALSQFPAVKRVATGVLASSAVLGLVVGFAARQTLANAVAGILLAITQPIRVGDFVTFEGSDGTVEDVRLTYTYVRTGDGRRLVIPNERLAQSTVENHTLVESRVRVEVSLWIDRDADVEAALAALRRDADLDVSIAEVDREGIRLTASTWAERPEERGAIAARVRGECLERLRKQALSSNASEP